MYFHTLSGEEGELTKEEWDAKREGMVCTLADNYSDIEAILLKLCYRSRSCTYQQKKALKNFRAKLTQLQERTLSK